MTSLLMRGNGQRGKITYTCPAWSSVGRSRISPPAGEEGARAPLARQPKDDPVLVHHHFHLGPARELLELPGERHPREREPGRGLVHDFPRDLLARSATGDLRHHQAPPRRGGGG